MGDNKSAHTLRPETDRGEQQKMTMITWVQCHCACAIIAGGLISVRGTWVRVCVNAVARRQAPITDEHTIECRKA